MFYFDTPWKRQKTKGFSIFSGGMEHWVKMRYCSNTIVNNKLKPIISYTEPG